MNYTDYLTNLIALLNKKLILKTDVYAIDNFKNIFTEIECSQMFEELLVNFEIQPIIEDQKDKNKDLVKVNDFNCKSEFKILNLGIPITIKNEVKIIGYLINKKY